MYNFRIITFFGIIFFISLISLISAYFIEYILGHQPCNLCLIERIPYALSIILVLTSYMFKKFEKFTVLLLSIIFAFSFIISVYHFGIEQGFFKESAVCNLMNTSDIISKEELLKQLQVKTVNCKDVTFRILGFSLTTFNIIISFIIFILLVHIFKNYEKYES